MINMFRWNILFGLFDCFRIVVLIDNIGVLWLVKVLWCWLYKFLKNIFCIYDVNKFIGCEINGVKLLIYLVLVWVFYWFVVWINGGFVLCDLLLFYIFVVVFGWF